MLVVHLTSTDPAGSVINFVKALNNFTDVRARLITTHRINEYAFESDIADIYDKGDEIDQLLKDADVIHFHKVTEDRYNVTVEVEPGTIWRKYELSEVIKKFPNKKIVYHVHGHEFERGQVKENAEMYEKKGRWVLCSG